MIDTTCRPGAGLLDRDTKVAGEGLSETLNRERPVFRESSLSHVLQAKYHFFLPPMVRVSRGCHKTNASGDTLWTRTYGGTGGDYGYSVQQTSDGGYINLLVGDCNLALEGDLLMRRLGLG